MKVAMPEQRIPYQEDRTDYVGAPRALRTGDVHAMTLRETAYSLTRAAPPALHSRAWGLG